MTAMPGLGSGVRVFPELRAAHLEEIDRPSPRRTIYFARKYDLGNQAIPSHCVAVTMPEALSILWRSNDATLELPEVLWLRFLPRWLLLATIWKLRRLRGVKRSSIVFFAIENNTVNHLLFQSGRAGPLVRKLAVSALRLLMRTYVSRCAFGTEAAAATYHSLLTPTRPVRRVTLDLLSSRRLPDITKEPLTVVFVGVLEERKGIHFLLAAWPQVEAVIEGAHLRIIGDGRLRCDVERWAASRPDRRSYDEMLPRNETLRLIGQATVLVAPSLRDGRWREQVGRPIQEALATGATVVTTAETGLAGWLTQNGHRVINPSAMPDRLADNIICALRHPLRVDDVLATLPAHDGRLTADNWLHQ
jgi:glycosyltransferase involved in cell wall biosynthesis